MGYAVFVFGSAGSGKSTFCRKLKERSKPGRSFSLVNLDPACENTEDYDVDLCDHITVDEVMENYDFGPNGGMFFALEEMVKNIESLKLADFSNEYLLIDCPGQIELFLHSTIMNDCIQHVQEFSRVAIVYLFDSTIFTVPNKYLYTSLCAAICLNRLCLPSINVISKADLIEEELLERVLENEWDPTDGLDDSEYGKLSKTVAEYLDYSGISGFSPLNWEDEETVENILLHLDNILQRFDDEEPQEPKE